VLYGRDVINDGTTTGTAPVSKAVHSMGSDGFPQACAWAGHRRARALCASFLGRWHWAWDFFCASSSRGLLRREQHGASTALPTTDANIMREGSAAAASGVRFLLRKQQPWASSPQAALGLDSAAG